MKVSTQGKVISIGIGILSVFPILPVGGNDQGLIIGPVVGIVVAAIAWAVISKIEARNK